MVSNWNPRTETWYTNMAMENSSTIAESLTSCYALLEGAWGARSEGYKLVSEPKLRHALSSCKAFINLAISNQLSACETEASYWYSVNLLSSAISTVLFIAMTCLIARLRRSNRVKSKMKRYLPERWFDKGNKSKSWFHRSPPKAKPRTAFTATAPVNMAPQYTQQGQYKSTGIYPTLQGMTGVGTTPALQGQSGIPGSPYPVAGTTPAL